MTESGEVFDRDVVIVVLERNGVEVSGQDESPTDMLVLSKGSRIEGQQLPENNWPENGTLSGPDI